MDLNDEILFFPNNKLGHKISLLKKSSIKKVPTLKLKNSLLEPQL